MISIPFITIRTYDSIAFKASSCVQTDLVLTLTLKIALIYVYKTIFQYWISIQGLTYQCKSCCLCPNYSHKDRSTGKSPECFDMCRYISSNCWRPVCL